MSWREQQAMLSFLPDTEGTAGGVLRSLKVEESIAYWELIGRG